MSDPVRCPCTNPAKCLLCKRDFATIAERLAPYFRPLADECSDGRGGKRPAWRQPTSLRGSGGSSKTDVAARERDIAAPSRVSPRGLS